MILLKIFLNLLVLLTGLCDIVTGKNDLEKTWYPKWIGIVEIVVGIATCIFSFSVWFIN